MSGLTESILNRLSSVATPNGFIPLHVPEFSGNEINYLKDCVESNFVSSVGEYVDRFERMLAEYTGVERAVVSVNGTAALHMCLLLVGVEQGDEVLIPAMTFVATANAVSYIGATPHLIDIEEDSLGVDPSKLGQYLAEIAEVRPDGTYNKETGARIAAVVPMHTFGHPVEMDKLCEVADTFKVPIVEDAAESLGSFYKGRHTGNFGRVAALSFNGNKIITTGGGGAILTNDTELANRAKYLTTTAKVPHRWEYFHDEIGYNYRMPALNAALGCAQMEKLPEFLHRKRSLANKYAAAFEGAEGFRFFQEPAGAQSNYWLNAIVLDPEFSHLRDEILDRTNNSSIMTRPVWSLMNKLPHFSECPRMDLSNSISLEKRIINIPSSAYLAA